jgi:hypothetical protein
MTFQDGWLSALAKIITAMLARSTDIDYRALYGGVVLFRDGDKVTVRPDDERLGASLVCQLRRPDGYSSVSASGTACLIGWDGYDPSERYAVMAATSGQAATSVSVQAATVNLGDEQGQALATQQFVQALAIFAQTSSTATLAPQIAAAAATLLASIGGAPAAVPFVPGNLTTKTKAS